MRRGFFDPSPAVPTAPPPRPPQPVRAQQALERGAVALAAQRLHQAARLFLLAIRLDSSLEAAHELLADTRALAAVTVQARFRGGLLRRDRFYQSLLPVLVRPGHRRVRSATNLARYFAWLRAEADSGDLSRVAAAARCRLTLQVTDHRGSESNQYDSVFGPLPALPCQEGGCRRCAGPYPRGGFHFRHLGPWSAGEPSVFL